MAGECTQIDWSAVQAVGSILAIITGFGLVLLQNWFARQAEIRRELAAVRDTKRQILVFGELAVSRLMKTREALALRDSYRTIVDFQLLQGAIANDLAVLSSFNPVLNDVETLQSYFALRGALSILSDGLQRAIDNSGPAPGDTRVMADTLRVNTGMLLSAAEINLRAIHTALGAKDPSDIQ